MWKVVITISLLAALSFASDEPSQPEYIKQCKRSDPQLEECIKSGLLHLKPYLARGIPEVELPPVEPFLMDKLSLQLTDGPQGYKVTLENIEVFGASNYNVDYIKLSENDEPFHVNISMPKLRIEAKYTSSGVLLIIPASGGGDFHGEFEDSVGEIRGKTSTKKTDKGTFMHVDRLHLTLSVRAVKLNISRAFHNNRILTEATNLFLRENGLEVVRLMQPQLEEKLALQFGKIANQLLKHVTQEQFLTD